MSQSFTNLSTIVIEQPDHTVMIGLPHQVQTENKQIAIPVSSPNRDIAEIEFQPNRPEQLFTIRAETVHFTRNDPVSGRCFQMVIGLCLCGMVLSVLILLRNA
jgi:hypothetical protein